MVNLADYRTMRHPATYIVFVDLPSEVGGAVFSSLGASIKFLKRMKGHPASVHDKHGTLVAYSHEGGITFCQA